MSSFFYLNQVSSLAHDHSRYTRNQIHNIEDHVLWKKLDLSKLKSISFNIPLEARTNTWSDFQYSSKKPMKILKNNLNLSHGNVTCLVFHFYEFIKNELLICAAERYNVHSLI